MEMSSVGAGIWGFQRRSWTVGFPAQEKDMEGVEETSLYQGKQ
jgi:hypothetical protein